MRPATHPVPVQPPPPPPAAQGNDLQKQQQLPGLLTELIACVHTTYLSVPRILQTLHDISKAMECISSHTMDSGAGTSSGGGSPRNHTVVMWAASQATSRLAQLLEPPHLTLYKSVLKEKVLNRLALVKHGAERVLAQSQNSKVSGGTAAAAAVSPYASTLPHGTGEDGTASRMNHLCALGHSRLGIAFHYFALFVASVLWDVAGVWQGLTQPDTAEHIVWSTQQHAHQPVHPRTSSLDGTEQRRALSQSCQAVLHALEVLQEATANFIHYVSHAMALFEDISSNMGVIPSPRQRSTASTNSTTVHDAPTDPAAVCVWSTEHYITNVRGVITKFCHGVTLSWYSAVLHDRVERPVQCILKPKSRGRLSNLMSVATQGLFSHSRTPSNAALSDTVGSLKDSGKGGAAMGAGDCVGQAWFSFADVTHRLYEDLATSLSISIHAED